MSQEEALTILKTGANVFLTGEPGSGKTYTVNAYVAWLREHGIEPAITASTGIAATHIGGYTIHSWSGIGIKKHLSSYDLDRITQNEKVVGRVRSAKILIIDEISMLSAATFSMVEAVCREVRGNHQPFGGLQVLLVGDFFQLPPVVSREDNNEETGLFSGSKGLEIEPVAEHERSESEVRGSVSNPSTQFAFSSSAWKSLNPLVCYLEEQHRQEDDDFLNILGAIRSGDIDETHREMLASRRKTRAEAGVTQLFSHNADVNQINDQELAKISEVARVFSMTSRGPDRLVDALKRGCLSPESLALKVGARVMFTKNDVAGRSYVNGTLGTVTDFSQTGYPVVKTHSGKSLVVEPAEWQIVDQGRVLAQITQLPLRLAWAMTVHKSQGMSLDAAHMDLRQAFEYGQGYVALSRVRTLSGLSLAGLNERALEVHPEITEKDRELRAASDAARRAFFALPESELSQMQINFIKACGGSAEAKPVVPSEPGPSKLDLLRQKHPNAYRPWSKEEDELLKELFLSNTPQKELSVRFGRQRGAIESRLIKLGLIEDGTA
ncbi:MAG TPA: PIF1 family ATP-dependent DNA helicase [Candidatus Paceibacterota bacterium]|nr:PIF1 family ATP-dependent DNA helicase [Candidatus Paceibacterota bacterium]